MKIVVASDNHSNLECLNIILKDNPDADYYWHLGDSEFYSSDLEPFISVRGNNDYDYEIPELRIFERGGHRFLLIHGHRQLFININELANLAKEKDCDVVLYGHTHNPSDKTINNIRLLNPGSCFYNRSGLKPTYLIIEIDKKGQIQATIKELDYKSKLW